LDRLSRIDDHPQARTPEADELRVALHVAAAQLRDPAVRSNLTAPEPTPAQPAPSQSADPLVAPGASEVGRAAAPPGVVAPQAITVDEEFKVAAEHVLASCGGWNAESKRRLGYLAQSASVDAGGLQQALVAITRQHEQPIRGKITTLGTGITPAGGEVAEPISPLSRAGAISKRPLDHRIGSSRARAWLTITTAIMFVSSLVIGMGLLTLVAQELLKPERQIQTRVISGTTGNTNTSKPPSTPGTSANPTDATEEPSAVPTPPIVADGQVLVRYFQSLSADSFADATDESLAGFISVYDQFASNWIGFDPDTVAAAPIAIRDAVLATMDVEDSIAIRAIEPMSRDLTPLNPDERSLDPRALTRAVFAYGTLSLFQGAAIPPHTERTIRTQLNTIASSVAGGSGGGTGFEARARVALEVIASKLVPRASESDVPSLVTAWRSWIVMAQRFDPLVEADLLLGAIERIAQDAEKPSINQATVEVIKSLVHELEWHADPDQIAGRRLLEWFDSPGDINDEMLSVITGELVDRGLLPGLDASMKLSTGGSEQDRRSLRDQYALRLSLPLIGEGAEFAREWAGYAEELLGEGLPSDHRGALDRAVRAARLNEAASLWIASDEATARDVTKQALIGLEALTASAAGPVSFARGSTRRADGEWAEKYLLARRNTDERNRLLYELENTGGPAGEADADVLAEAASYSTPMEIRRHAQSIVIAYSDREWMLIGLLEVLPRAAEQENVSDMLSAVTGRSLPPVDDQNWRIEARKALVARLLEIMVDPDQRYLEVAGTTLERSLRVRADLLAPAADTPEPAGLDAIEQSMQISDSQPVGPAEIAWEYADRLARLASMYPQRTTLFATLPEIESRRVWRVRLVKTDTGLFAAQTTSVLEFTAYIYGSERPANAHLVNEIVAEAAAARRSAGSVYEQIATNELAILRINLLRLKGGA
ncbi:MAG: hypothetical protein ACF8MJ_09815, partial [Phycisphaerales bacterium JB050]